MYCAAITNEWKQFVPNVDVTVKATPGSMANYIPLDKGELHLAVGSNIGNYYASEGIKITEKKLSNISTMIPISMNFCHAFVYSDSPIKTYQDLKGKNVLVGPKATTGAFLTEGMFKSLGVDVKFVYTTQSEAINMMKDKRADAMVYHVAAPWSGIMDIATGRSIRFLSLTPEDQKKIGADAPFLIPTTVPSKTYDFQKEDMETISTFGCVNVNADVPEEIVYKLTKVAWDRFDEMVKGMESLKWMKPRYVLDMNAQIHPGAARRYKEIGVKVPDKLIWQKQ